MVTSTKKAGRKRRDRRALKIWKSLTTGLFDTQAAMLWDDEHLYVGFWVEEPDIRATLTERDSMICRENDVEVFIAGQDAYYEFELNALGTIMERFYIWQDRYIEAGYADIPEFALIDNGIVDTLGGHWSGHKSARGAAGVFARGTCPACSGPCT